jgi:peptidoglycan-associated lipoprotein
MKRATFAALLLAALVGVAACGGDPDPVEVPTPPGPPPGAFPGSVSDATPTRPPDPPPIPLDSGISSAPLGSWDAMSIDEINSAADPPLKPIFYAFDSDEISEEAKQVLAANADVLRRYETWVVTIEGHTDERGTPEYNLALGDRRAMAARTYLISLGIPAQRLRTVSYGKEFPFDPGHTEEAWAQNRRAHFMLTSK